MLVNSGNALTLLCQFRYSDDSNALERAAEFTLKALEDESLENATMLLDAPFSLFNGLGARAMLLMEIYTLLNGIKRSPDAAWTLRLLELCAFA